MEVNRRDANTHAGGLTRGPWRRKSARGPARVTRVAFAGVVAAVALTSLFLVSAAGAGSTAKLRTATLPYLCGPERSYACLTASGYAGQSVWGANNGLVGHNCTSYANYRLRQNGSPQPWPSPMGNANAWKDRAQRAGYRVDGTPAVGSIAWWGSGSLGHVAYVESVTSSSIIVSEDHYITNAPGYDDRKQINSGTSAWPEAFLHIRDGATAPPPPATPVQLAFVGRVYVDLLGRPGGAAEVLGWANKLAGGESRQQLALEIEAGAEYRTRLVQTMYTTFLHRSADPRGLNGWIAQLQNGAPDEQVLASIIGSDEYYSRAGGTTGAFLSRVYQDVLHRAIDASGLAAWSGMLAQGKSRAQAANSILTSTEARQKLVQGYYLQFLHRAADPGGLNLWLAQLQNGASDEQVLAGIVGSDEYFNKIARSACPTCQ
jgi:surface antigen